VRPQRVNRSQTWWNVTGWTSSATGSSSNRRAFRGAVALLVLGTADRSARLNAPTLPAAAALSGLLFWSSISLSGRASGGGK
jgi:hypothetical protein